MYSEDLNAFISHEESRKVYRYDIPIYCDYRLDVDTMVKILEHMQHYLLDNYPDVELLAPWCRGDL